ncbi:phosphatase PAP2 family protein [Egbenema bharatensis]|uniref:phosphatase PAP2 family protein n=1 Tax=Egbenema bharatensis TaxID=3463334 RepID=UPI003A89E141
MMHKRLNLRLGERLTSFAQFLKQWFRYRWEAFLLIGLGFYLPLTIFVLLAVQIWRLEGGLGWDVVILNAIYQTHRPALDTFATAVTNLGTIWGVLPASIAISLGLLYVKRWRSLTYFFITAFGEILINRGAKLWFHRVRPALWDRPPVAEFSFPSGHAMSSMVFIAALLILTWKTRWRNWVLLFGSIFVITIGWTRLYLGVHYPSDILAGWMMAIAWAVSMRSVIKPQLSRSVARDEAIVLEEAEK